MTIRDKNSTPIPPGETIAELLEERTMTQADLARRTGRSRKFINQLVSGGAPLMPETALELEAVFGVPAHVWNNLEAIYRGDLAQQEYSDFLKSQTELAQEFPYKEMAEHGWVPETHTNTERANYLLNFFEVSALEHVAINYPVTFRKARTKSTCYYSVLAWLRKGEIDGRGLETNVFEAHKLNASFTSLRSLSQHDPKDFYPKASAILANCGVALVFTETLPNAPISGASRWLSKDKALIQLSLRYPYWDTLFFNLFHEIGHISRHSKKVINVDFDRETPNEDAGLERDADKFASDELVSAVDYKKFLITADFSDAAIESFSKELGISPAIVYGRLAHDGHITYASASKHRPQVAFAKSP